MSTKNVGIRSAIPSEVIETVINVMEKSATGRPIGVIDAIVEILMTAELHKGKSSSKVVDAVWCLKDIEINDTKNHFKDHYVTLCPLLLKNITIGRVYDAKVFFSCVTEGYIKEAFGIADETSFERLKCAMETFFQSVSRLVEAHYEWTETSDGFYVLGRKRNKGPVFYYRPDDYIHGERTGYTLMEVTGDARPTPYVDKIPHMTYQEVTGDTLLWVKDIPQCPGSQEPCGGIHDKCLTLTYTTCFPEQQSAPVHQADKPEPVAEAQVSDFIEVIEVEAHKTMTDEDYVFLKSLPPIKLKEGIIQVWETVGDDPEPLTDKIATYLGYEIISGSPTCVTYRENLATEKDWIERYGKTVFENGKFKIDNWIGNRLGMKLGLNLTPKEGKEVSVEDATKALIALSLLLDVHVRIIENRTTKALIGEALMGTWV